MDPTKILGTEATYSAKVTKDMCPAFDGEVVHEVYSTWSMAHHMEIAARHVLVPHLAAGEQGIGGHLSIDHVSPQPLGRIARVVARCIEADESTVVCEVVAYDGDSERILGRGKQVQRIYPEDKLNELIERYK